MPKRVDKLKFPLKEKYVALVAPSFVGEFSYQGILYKLKKLGFDKIVELTFGAKIVNREYQKKLKNVKKMMIASTCPGIVSTVNSKFPQLKDNLLKIDSPMIAMGKICKKYFPEHKTVFISPCDFKKIEAENSKYVDYVIDYQELRELCKIHKIKSSLFKKKLKFDKFYNDYTKIYPLAGGLAKTAHIKNIIRKDEFVSIDGIQKVTKFLEHSPEKIKFLDCLFCDGGCIGGPHTTKKLSIAQKKKRVLNYLKRAKKEDIPENRKGLIGKAKDLNFSSEK
jgi:iron only hydrogenase large subunit-like protein